MKSSRTIEVSVLGGRYRLDHVLGRGGMGAVWAGHDKVLDRPVAVKMLRDDLGTAAPQQRERLLAEARSVAAVQHPNLVTAFDAGADDGIFAIVMERLPGPSLADRLHQGPLTADEVRAVGSDMLAGLGALHAAGLVHRDVKPGNVLRGGDGRWMLVDFGVAKNLQGGQKDLTVPGNTVGTPSYIAPEQLFGAAPTPGADLWAVAVLLYQALTGQLPFDGTTPYAIAYAASTTAPTPLSELVPDADPAIAATVERALQKSLDQRFESAAAMAAALHDASTPVPAPPAAPPEAPARAIAAGAPRAWRRSSTLRLALAALIVVAVTAVTAVGLGPAGDHGDADPSTTFERPSTGNDRGSRPSTGPGAAKDDPSATPSSDAAGPSGDGSATAPATSSATGALSPTDGAAAGQSSSTTAPSGTDPPDTSPSGTEPPTTSPTGTDPPVTSPPDTDPGKKPDKPKPPRPTPSSTIPPGRP